MSEKWIQFLHKYRFLLVLVVGGLVIWMTFLFVFLRGQTEEAVTTTELAPLVDRSEQVVEPSSTTQPLEDLIVDVKGAVKKPGIYYLAVGSRIYDAVEAAGGLTEEADSKSINLAQKVSDEGVIYVATKEEAISVVPATTRVETGGSGGEKADLVNLNTATEAELQTISGIGAKRAADIIAYRESRGYFQSVDDLKGVAGIGNKSLEKIRPYVTVE